MFRSVFGKTFFEKRWFIISWALGIFAMVVLTMVFYPFFKDSGFDEIINTAPKELQSLLGQADNYKTVAGYVAEQIFAMRLPAMIIVMTIALFIGVGVGDESRGTLESLLAQPISRAKVYWQKFMAGAIISALICMTIFVAVCFSFVLIDGSMNLGRLTQATFACWLLGLAVGAFAYALGAITGNRGLSLGLASGIAFLSFMISSMAPAVQGLQQVQKVSIFYYYNSPQVALYGLSLRNSLVLVGITIVMSLIGLAVFQRRDLVRD